MSFRNTLLALSCAASLLPAVASAQHTHSWDIQGKIGVGIPLGDLADTNDLGLSLGLGLTRWLAPRYGLHFGGASNMLAGKDGFPDVDLWHYNGGVEFDLINPQTSKWRLHANLGLGGTTAQPSGGGSSTDFTINAGMNLERPIAAHFNILGGVDFYAILAEETAYVLPVMLGFRYFFSE